MPKKFKGENSKAATARARKQAQKDEEDERKQKAIEEEYWRDDDKHVMRKQHRKEDKERRRVEQLERKKEAQQLLEDELTQIKSAKPPPTKVTRAEIEANKARMAAEAAAGEKQQPVMHDEVPLEENVNRLKLEGEEARGVDEALVVLSGNEPKVDRHPEKRVKAAYTAFEEKNLPVLKAENPNMRLSQLKQMIKKDWMKSPENPLNQRTAAIFNDRK